MNRGQKAKRGRVAERGHRRRYRRHQRALRHCRPRYARAFALYASGTERFFAARAILPCRSADGAPSPSHLGSLELRALYPPHNREEKPYKSCSKHADVARGGIVLDEESTSPIRHGPSSSTSFARPPGSKTWCTNQIHVGRPHCSGALSAKTGNRFDKSQLAQPAVQMHDLTAAEGQVHPASAGPTIMCCLLSGRVVGGLVTALAGIA